MQGHQFLTEKRRKCRFRSNLRRNCNSLCYVFWEQNIYSTGKLSASIPLPKYEYIEAHNAQFPQKISEIIFPVISGSWSLKSIWLFFLKRQFLQTSAVFRKVLPNSAAKVLPKNDVTSRKSEQLITDISLKALCSIFLHLTCWVSVRTQFWWSTVRALVTTQKDIWRSRFLPFWQPF